MVQKGRELPVWKTGSSPLVKDARPAVGKVIIPIKRSQSKVTTLGLDVIG